MLAEWASKVDPNVVVGLVSLLAAWLWHKVRGDKQQDLRSLLYGAITAEVHRIAERPDLQAKAREILVAVAWKALTPLKVPRNTTTELLVSAMVETGMAELARLLAQRAFPFGLDAVAKKTQDVVDAFEPPTNPKVPRLAIELEEQRSEDITPVERRTAAAEKVREKISKAKGDG